MGLLMRKGIPYGATGGPAILTEYENAESGLSADNVQDAIDEIQSNLTASNHIPFRFGIAEGGKYGIVMKDVDGNDIVVPFGEKLPDTPDTPTGSTVTYICNGVTHEEAVAYGANVLNPNTFTPAADGATFLGWSLAAGNTTVQNNLIMGEEPITLYAVFKYADKSVSMSAFYQEGDDSYGWGPGHASVTNISSIDFTKYSGLSFSYSASLGQNHIWCTAYITVSCGGASTNLIGAYRGDPDSVVHQSQNATSGTRTLTFTQNTGTGNCTTTTTGDGSVGGASATFSNAKLIGRSVVG